MAEIPFAGLKALARELRSLEIDYAFTGGSIVGLLLDNPELSPVRPTDDVDVIVEVLSRRVYPSFEERLRSRGFQNDTSHGAPMCRWKFNTLTVDVMPVEASFLGLNTIWFDHALAGAVEREIDGDAIRIVSGAGFVATKLAAFNDRGEGDFYGSHDLEDIVTVVDGRESLVAEMRESDESLKRYVAREFSKLVGDSGFIEALPAHLPPDAGSQARVPLLLQRLKKLAAL